MEKNPTPQMETALYRTHGVCYEEYYNSFEVRQKVEEKREEDYQMSKNFIAEQSYKSIHLK